MAFFSDTRNVTRMHIGMNLPLRILFISLLALTTRAASAQDIYFTATGALTASAESIRGRVELTLHAPEAIHGAQLSARTYDGGAVIGELSYWEPGSQRAFDFELASPHEVAGDYHLLLEVAFRDKSGANLGAALSFPYRVGASELDSGLPPRSAAAAIPISVELQGDQLIWQLTGDEIADVELTLTTEPSWDSPRPLKLSDTRIVLNQRADRQGVPNWSYRQKARLDWKQDGRHFSRVVDWTIHTDSSGNWMRSSGPVAIPWWRQSTWLWAVAALIAAGAGILAWTPGTRRRHVQLNSRHEEWIGVTALLALTAWLIAHSNPALWLTHTWATGGDVASQVFYASVFMEWLPSGKISGWLPESFAGFPAFTFYFPFPFTFAGLLQFAVGPQVAFKLVSMLPAFLLPAATYGLGKLWDWPVTTRLVAAAGAAAFILADATSIWGGNVLGQLSGEFAYSWGLLFVALFWGVLSVALRRGGRWWLLAGLLEALVALSHGYALLVAGFGAFLYLLVSRTVWRDLRIILQVHLLAFLLVGFWLVPLLENLPWTIPNDSAMSVSDWRILWPSALWPLTLGWIPLLLLARQPQDWPRGIVFLLGICVLGLLGFLGGSRVGLADLRFFPFTQWALAVASGAALGWSLQRWLRPVSLPLAIALIFGLSAWWEPRLDNMENWSRWNLSGYEAKAMWPHYLATAQTNAGPLHGPRLVFEHDPANNDLGSTRTLEALPMFGSRPALEGLYMESAISGPFIYQLQAEISQRPSSPLSRYPASARSVEDAVGHLNELYANRLILRSGQKKALFGADPRFELIAQHGPLSTYELRDLRSRLVEVVDIPLVSASREDWLSLAFRRFLLDFPYRERHVYLGADQQLPTGGPPTGQGRVEVREFSRERLAFETDRPGQPHLIRMTYHPRWTSTGGEQIFLVDPSFMLIYPQNSEVELVYGWSWGNWVGVVFSLGGFMMLVCGFWWVSPFPPVVDGTGFPVQRRRLLIFLVAASLAMWVIRWTDPERVYMRGHQSLAEQDGAGAAALFDQAYEGRQSPASRAEALFWAARSLDLSGAKNEAAVRYAKVRLSYPQSYWYPESVFRLIEIHRQNGELDTAEVLYTELVEAVPDNPWTHEVEKSLQPAGRPW